MDGAEAQPLAADIPNRRTLAMRFGFIALGVLIIIWLGVSTSQVSGTASHAIVAALGS